MLLDDTKNLYLKVLIELRKNFGDGKMHPVDTVLSTLDRDEKLRLLRELRDSGYIVLDDKQIESDGRVSGFGWDGPPKDHKYPPINALMTLKGEQFQRELENNELNHLVSEHQKTNPLFK